MLQDSETVNKCIVPKPIPKVKIEELGKCRRKLDKIPEILGKYRRIISAIYFEGDIISTLIDVFAEQEIPKVFSCSIWIQIVYHLGEWLKIPNGNKSNS